MALLHSSSAFAASTSRSSDLRTARPLRKIERSDIVGQQYAGLSKCGRKMVVIAVSFSLCVRKPSLPQAGLLSKPTTLITERVLCTDVLPNRKIELRYAKPPLKDFCEFIETTPKQEVIAFFRDVAYELEKFRQLRDFHMKVRDGEGDFRIEVYFGEDHNGPEVSVHDDCSVCCPDTNIFVGQEPGMTARECILEEFSHRPYAICSLDPKGRSGFAVTSVRHVERMSELDDDELYAMWSVAVRTLRHIGIPFISLIINHGTYRTVYHLKIKVWLDNQLYEQHRATWGEERKELWDRLQKYAINRPRKQQVCFFYRRDKFCRHGDMCSFSHAEY